MKTKIIKSAFDWCVEHYKRSKYYKLYPNLSINYSKHTPYHGEFYNDTDDINILSLKLIIYIETMDDKDELVKTVIHEYQHYLQHPSWMTRYTKTKTYRNDPYENQAEDEAERSYKQCIKEMKL